MNIDIVLNGNPVSLPEHMRHANLGEAPEGKIVYVSSDAVHVDQNFCLWLKADAGFYFQEEILEDEEYFPVLTHEDGFAMWLNIEEQFTMDKAVDVSELIPVTRLTLTD